MKTTTLTASQASKLRFLLACGALTGPFFTGAWLASGFTRANYDALRHPISSLAIGESGWTQFANFLITGALLLAFALGLKRALQLLNEPARIPFLIAAVGIGLLGAAIFVTDPLNGYPLGTPELPLQYSLAGRLHRLFSAFVFLGLPIACFLFARFFRRRGEHLWAVYSRVSGIAYLLMFIVTTLAFAQLYNLAQFAGLLQRITLTIGFAWLTLLALYWLKVPFKTIGETETAERVPQG